MTKTDKNLALVTVVVPLFNHEKYIVECLESIKNNGYPNLEVIVVDDGSTDDSYKKAVKWRSTNPKEFSNFILEKKKNEGIIETLNYLIKKATGEYITLLASDDILLPLGIEKRLFVLESSTDCKAVIGDSIVIDDNSQKILNSAISDYKNGNKKALLDNRFIITELLLRWTVPGPIFLARTEVFDDLHGVGLYRSGMGTEDREFYLRLLSKGWLRFVDFPVAGYRVHDSNFSSIRDVKAANDFILSECNAVENFKGFNKLLMQLRCVYYQLKLKRRQRADYWPIYSFGEMMLMALLWIFGIGFNSYVFITHTFVRK